MKILSDVIALAKKAFEGKVNVSQGSQGTTGDIISITAGAGKDMYLAGAKFSASHTTSSVIAVDLKVNNTTVETGRISFRVDISGGRNNAGGAENSYEFITKGVKVEAGQTIKLEVITNSGNKTVEGTIHTWQEDNGVDPFDDFK